MPEMGYVKRRLPGVHSVGYSPLVGISNKRTLDVINDRNYLYLYALNTIQVFWSKSYTPQRGDAILLKDMTLRAPV